MRLRPLSSPGTARTGAIRRRPVISVASPPQNIAVRGMDTWSPIPTWSPPAYNADLVARCRDFIGGPD
jgi:hypothetical protein